MKNLVLLLLFCFCQNIGFGQLTRDNAGQEEVAVDVVYLTDGSVLKGKLISWQLGDSLKITIASGNTITLPSALVAKVRQEERTKDGTGRIKIAKLKTFNFKETGVYNNIALSFPMGSEFGVSLTYSVGHRFSRIFGLGGGIGVEDFELGAASQVVPIFGEIRGFTSKKSISPFYNIRAGYGIPLTNDKFNVVDGKGGLMFHPEVGFRFGGHNGWFYMGAGIRFQNVTYVRELPWWQEGISEDKITFKRIDIKFGVEF